MSHPVPAPRASPGRPALFVLVGLVLAAVAGIMTLKQLELRARVSEPTTIATRRVIVAARPISRGQEVEAELLGTLELPADAAPADAVESAAEVVGKLARSTIYADDVLTRAKFLETHATSALSGLIPEGRRAISMNVNEVSGISGFVAPGSHVDVLLTVSGGEDEPSRTVTVVQDAEVLAVGQSTQDDDGRAQLVATVTLNVDPRQAEVIAIAAREGKLQLALRNARDDGRMLSLGISLDELIGGTTAQPVGAAVELIRGVERTASTF